MSTTIRIELARPCDAADLVEFLATRGLSGTVVSADDDCALEVGYALDPTRRLRRDVETALAAWLEASQRPLIETGGPDGAVVLRPPAD
jgi:hypothetical protein